MGLVAGVLATALGPLLDSVKQVLFLLSENLYVLPEEVPLLLVV